MTTKNMRETMNMSTEIRELNDHELLAVSGGEVAAKGSVADGFVIARTPGNNPYQDWADLGQILGRLSAGEKL